MNLPGPPTQRQRHNGWRKIVGRGWPRGAARRCLRRLRGATGRWVRRLLKRLRLRARHCRRRRPPTPALVSGPSIVVRASAAVAKGAVTAVTRTVAGVLHVLGNPPLVEYGEGAVRVDSSVDEGTVGAKNFSAAEEGMGRGAMWVASALPATPLRRHQCGAVKAASGVGEDAAAPWGWSAR